MTSFTRNKIFFLRNSYLSRLELINKFNLDDVKNVPSLSKVSIEISILKFLKGFFTNKTEYNLDVQIKSMLVLYLLVFNFPFINYKIIEKKLKNHQKNGDIRHFSLKTTITHKDILYPFLIKILKENGTNFVSALQKKSRSINFRSYKNCFLYTTPVYLQNLSDVNIFLNRVLSGINSQDLFLNLSLKIFSPLALKMKFVPLYS